jgi:hypothetical protein
MISLDVADLVVIAGQTLGIGTAAALSQCDAPTARAALVEADCRHAVNVDHDGAAEAGIRVIHALLRHRPFPVDGDRIAVAAGLQFLSLNGWRADFESPGAAAVVIEALASGQLSPSDAAAWLSRRLAADPRVRARRVMVPQLRSLPSFRSPLPVAVADSPPPPAGPKPVSVRYSQLLLFVQAGFWALAGLTSLLGIIVAVGDGGGLFVIAGAYLGAGLAVAKRQLAVQVGRGRSRRLRLTIIATELAMTGFGLLWLLVPTPWVQVPGLGGAVLSLAAVLCMMLPGARGYFDGPAVAPGSPDAGARPGPASFRRLTLTGPYPAPAALW